MIQHDRILLVPVPVGASEWYELPANSDYEINIKGQIRNSKQYILKNFISHQGYIKCKVANKTVAVHRMMAILFIPNPENKPHVNHIDSNRANFSIDNLEWVTAKENHAHACKFGNLNRSENGKKGGKANALRSGKPLNMVDVSGNIIAEFPNIMTAQKELGVHHKTLKAYLYKGMKYRRKYIIVMKNTNILHYGYDPEGCVVVGIEKK